MKPSFKDILAGVDRGARAKAGAKIPDWAGADLEYPSALCLEQCSSSAAAAHKARIAAGFLPRISGNGCLSRISGNGCLPRIADLTGGLGADAYAFSKVASAVWYNERDAVLAAAVERNFARLGVRNVEFHSFEVGLDGKAAGVDVLPEWLQSLRAFAPDLIYLDPARRSAAGKKVFLLEDCSPDIAALWPLLLEVAPVVMVKLSPMADITMVCRRLGGHVSEVHVVGLDRECKELVCVLRRDVAGGAGGAVGGTAGGVGTIVSVDELAGSGGDAGRVAGSVEAEFRFTIDEENASVLSLPASLESVSGILLDPSPALLKSGARKILCSRLGLVKLGQDTHLYLSGTAGGPGAAAGSAGAAPGATLGSGSQETELFRRYRIVYVVPFSKASCREVAASYPCADVTAKNIQMTSDALRLRLGVRPAAPGGVHIFGVGVDYCPVGKLEPDAGLRSEKILVVCGPL